MKRLSTYRSSVQQLERSHTRRRQFFRYLRIEELEGRWLLASDFGDAPAPYPTLLVENGAEHLAIGPTLGANRDTEANGMHSIDAIGEDKNGTVDDEDGVSFGMIQVGQLDASVIVNVQNAAGS